MGAWGGHKNGAIPLSALSSVEGHYFKPDVAKAMAAALAEVRAKGIAIHINEGYRPLGVPADQYIRNERKTSTKSSNQWFQYGRMNRGETPSAAYPGGSIHGWGMAADVSPGRNNATVASVFKKHGFVFDIASESWHCSFSGGTSGVRATVKRGSKGNDVKYLQTKLKIAADGDFGPKTHAAVVAFQKSHGLVADGIVGPKTWAAIG